MTGRRRHAPSPQHMLVDHELPVVLADCPWGGAEARVRQVSGRRPLPNLAELAARPGNKGAGVNRAGVEHGVIREGLSSVLPLRLGRQARPRPAGEGVGLVVADVRDWLGGVDPNEAAEVNCRQPVPSFSQ